MSDLEKLRREVAGLVAALSPWISMEEMQARYIVCSKTLLAMERRGDIPTRVKGRWSRADVMEWESRVSA